MVEVKNFAISTHGLKVRCSNFWATPPFEILLFSPTSKMHLDREEVSSAITWWLALASRTSSFILDKTLDEVSAAHVVAKQAATGIEPICANPKHNRMRRPTVEPGVSLDCCSIIKKGLKLSCFLKRCYGKHISELCLRRSESDEFHVALVL